MTEQLETARPVPQHQATTPPSATAPTQATTQPPALTSPREANGRLASGYRIVHVPVPEPIFNQAKANAYLSGQRFAVYVANVLRDAKPYLDHRPPTATYFPPTDTVAAPASTLSPAPALTPSPVPEPVPA